MMRIFRKAKPHNLTIPPQDDTSSSNDDIANCRKSVTSRSDEDDEPLAMKTSTMKKKRVVFHDEVFVLQFDRDGQLQPAVYQSFSSAAREKLKRRSMRDQMTLNDFDHQSEHPYFCSTRPSFAAGETNDAFSSPKEYRKPQPPSRHTVSLSNPDTEIKYHVVKDKLRGNLLLFCISLGRGYDPQSVMVKANENGKRIRVVACSKGPNMIDEDKKPVKLEFNRKLTLPVAIDPCRLLARVDVMGNLKIEAAILGG